MLGNLQNLEQYMEKHSMDVATVRRLGLDLGGILESGEPHGEIKMSTILVDSKGHFTLDNSGELSESDPSADIYALGMLMYRLLNKGRLPFMPPYPANVTKEDKERAISRCLSGEVFPVPANGDSQIAEILHTACHPDRTMRYRSFKEMQWALGAPVNSTISANDASKEELASPSNTYETEKTEDSEISTYEEVPVSNASTTANQRYREEVQPTQATQIVQNTKKNAGGSGKSKEWGADIESRPPSRIAQGILIFLSAALAIAYIVMEKTWTISGSQGMILYGYCVIQAVLVILAMKYQGMMKVLGVLTILDMLYVLLYGVILNNIMTNLGLSLPAFYKPGSPALIFPIIELVVFLLALITKGGIHNVKIRFFTAIMLILSLLMVLLGLTGFNIELMGMNMYPYEAGLLLLLFALLAVESRSGRAVGKVMCVLALILDLVLMVFHAFSTIFGRIGLPVDLVGKIIVAVLFIFCLLSFILTGRKQVDEYTD